MAASQQGKVRLLTGTFRRKFAAPSELNPRRQTSDPSERSLPPFRGRIQEDSVPARVAEAKKAIRQMPANKTPGPGGIPTEVYKRLPPLLPCLAAIINEVYRTGLLPKAVRTIYIVPFPKAGKDPRDPSNKRPISLFCTIMRIVECVVYQRIVPKVEPSIYEGQYAYLRPRSTEHHLSLLHDFAHRSLLRKKYVYMISFDVAAAFDCVPHFQLTLALRNFGVDGHSRCLIHTWLRGRFYRVKLRTATRGLYGEPA